MGFDEIKIQKYVKVTDDWYPNFKNNTVKVILMNQKYYAFVRICVWGADDYGLEMTFKGISEENEQKFTEWKENIFDKIPEYCNKEYFKKLGLKNT